MGGFQAKRKHKKVERKIEMFRSGEWQPEFEWKDTEYYIQKRQEEEASKGAMQTEEKVREREAEREGDLGDGLIERDGEMREEEAKATSPDRFPSLSHSHPSSDEIEEMANDSDEERKRERENLNGYSLGGSLPLTSVLSSSQSEDSLAQAVLRLELSLSSCLSQELPALPQKLVCCSFLLSFSLSLRSLSPSLPLLFLSLSLSLSFIFSFESPFLPTCN